LTVRGEEETGNVAKEREGRGRKVGEELPDG